MHYKIEHCWDPLSMGIPFNSFPSAWHTPFFDNHSENHCFLLRTTLRALFLKSLCTTCNSSPGFKKIAPHFLILKFLHSIVTSTWFMLASISTIPLVYILLLIPNLRSLSTGNSSFYLFNKNLKSLT